MKTARKALAAAIACFESQAAFAEAVGVQPQLVSQWKARGIVPSTRVLDIEEVTKGAATRYQLRPDVFGERKS
jgi:DNA-binding transcriptional regulator YdaS (Cro superfamily)